MSASTTPVKKGFCNTTDGTDAIKKQPKGKGGEATQRPTVLPTTGVPSLLPTFYPTRESVTCKTLGWPMGKSRMFPTTCAQSVFNSRGLWRMEVGVCVDDDKCLSEIHKGWKCKDLDPKLCVDPIMREDIQHCCPTTCGRVAVPK